MTQTLSEQLGTSFSDRYAEYCAAREHFEEAARCITLWSDGDLRPRDELLDNWVRASERLEAATEKIATTELRHNA
jgi:hypothetical protein